MLRFVAAVAAAEGLEDYRVIVNVGPRAGQTVFHLHWHVLGGKRATRVPLSRPNCGQTVACGTDRHDRKRAQAGAPRT